MHAKEPIAFFKQGSYRRTVVVVAGIRQRHRDDRTSTLRKGSGHEDRPQASTDARQDVNKYPDGMPADKQFKQPTRTQMGNRRRRRTGIQTRK